MDYDVIIIGGGPAGVAATVYVGRKQMKALLMTETFGGQSVVSDDIQNWIGTVSISGIELAKNFESHVRAQETVTVKMPELASKIEKDGGGFVVTTDNGVYTTKSIIVALGGKRRKLRVPGEAEFEGKGVVYCSTCDAPLFGGMDVIVVGGGNAGLEAVVDLIPYAKHITLMIRRDEFRGDPITQETIRKNEDKIDILTNTEIEEIKGGKMVTGVKYKNNKTGEAGDIDVQGVFVEIGSIPNSDIVKGLVELNDNNEVVVNHQTAETSIPGIFAAGDVTDEKYKQNNVAVGNGVVAALSAYAYVLKKKHA